MNIRISQRSVEKLEAPAKGNRILWDDKIAGFGIRVTAAGAKSFVLDYYIKGRRRRYTIGAWPKWSADAARDEAKALDVKIRDGIDPLGEKEFARGEPTMAELAKQYTDEHLLKHKHGKSIYEDKRMLKKIIVPKLGTLRVSAINLVDVRRLHNSLSKTSVQANRVLALLSKMFTFAMEEKMRPDNPAKGIDRFPEDKREQWFTVDQLHAFSDALDAYSEQDAAEALRLLIVTGARPGEVIGATWPMFDLKRRVWTKPSHHTKERKIEHVPLNDAAIFILRRMAEKKDGVFLFPGRKEETARTTLRNAWRQVCKSAGFATVTYKTGKRGKPLPRWKPTVRVYDFRHTFASHLVSGGASLETIGMLMGHTQPSTTKRYAHVNDKAQRDVTNKFPDVLTMKRLA